MSTIKTHIPATPVAQTLARRVEQYIRVRDQIDAMEEAHKKRKAPLLEIQNQLTGMMMAWLEQTGADSVKTPNGTFTNTTKTTASLDDPDAFMDFVKANNQFNLMNRVANPTAVRDFVEKNGSLPPGVNLATMRSLRVSRPRKKKVDGVTGIESDDED